MLVMMVFVFRRDGLPNDVRMQFNHRMAITANRADIPSLLPAFRAGEQFGGEQRRGGRRAAENGVGFAHVVFEEAGVFAVLVAHDAEVEFGVAVTEGVPGGRSVDLFHEGAGALEVAVNDVDVVDFVAAEEEGEADVPEGLEAGAEDADGVDVGAAGEDEGCGEGGAEGGEG